MTETTQYDNPNDIDSLSTLKIQAVSGNLSPSIYANGRNQLPIQITVKAVNKDGNPLKFSKETWISILNLRFAESDEKLNRKGSSGWCFTEVENEYSVEIQPGSHRSKRFTTREDGTAIIILYVYTDGINTKRIAVSVDTPNGKRFTTADIASGAEKMFLTIISHPKINYADKANLSISAGSFVEVSSNLGWTSRLDLTGPYKEHYNGTCKLRTVRVYPNTPLKKFYKHQMLHDSIENNDVNDGAISWISGENKDENGFTLIQNNADYPCSVLGHPASIDDYQLNLWFSEKKNIHLDGHMYIGDDNYYYRFCPYVKKNHSKDDDENVPKLLLYKFTVPVNNARQLRWRDVVRPVTVNVTDFYGNTGTFQLTFNDTDLFDTPGIV